MSLLFAAAVYLFFGLAYPYHIHFQEQFQLFQSTGAYFREVVGVPGGLADYLGRFFTQFFYYAWGGATVIAIVLTAIQLVTWALIRKKSMLHYVLSFLPAAAMLVFMCDENALLGAPIALLLAEAAACIAMVFKPSNIRRIVSILLIPVLYFLLGGLAFVYVMVIAISDRKLWYILTAICIALLCPVVAHWIFPYLHVRLFFGIHYHRYHNVIQAWPWISAALVAVITALGEFEFRQRSKAAAFAFCIIEFLVVCGVSATLVSNSVDMKKEEIMKYDFMVRMQMWNRIMMTADQKDPRTPMTVSCLNLALAKADRLSGHMFEYFQNGPDGLLTKFTRDHISPIPTGEAYYHLGMVNAAQRCFFEAQEGIPDFQKSGRLHKRLVETNLLNGDYYVARKYLEPLKHAMFYKDWAKEIEVLLDNPERIDQHPEYGRIRDFRYKENDFMFSEDEMDDMLGLLYLENTENKLALDYLQAYTLLTKDLARFFEVHSLDITSTDAKPYQEAVVLYWSQTHGTPDGMPEYVTDSTVSRFEKFYKDMRTKDPGYMSKTYGDSYWYYYFYEYKS